MRRWLVLASVLLLAPTAMARAAALEPGGNDRVIAVVDGDTVILGNGRQVRLVGIQAPKLPLGPMTFLAWPFAEEARQMLADLVLYKTVALSFGGRRVDRTDRLLAHLHDESGRWIQGELLHAGMARVYSFADNTALVGEMLALERAARAARRGMWDHPFYRIQQATAMQAAKGTFQLVEGKVERVNVFGRRTYLSFGEREPADFSVAIVPADGLAFSRAQMVPRQLIGRKVRVRGWIQGERQPLIEVTHPEQIEVLD